jgi:TAG lipase/steryl ester hydrolase/phospholipase A2/LPA acyltransferase
MLKLVGNLSNLLPSKLNIGHQADKIEDVETIATLRKKLDQATTYEEWRRIALKLDELAGNEKWKRDNESTIFDYKLIESRLRHLKLAKEQAMDGGDVRPLLNIVRVGLMRNLGGMGDARLYEKCYIGTKNLIEEYVRTAVDSLDFLMNHDFPDISITQKFDFFWETRQAFGRTALCLSGGATLGMYHFGVLKTLFDNHLLPRIISGSSVGSIAASLVSTRTDEELPDLFEMKTIKFDAFDPKGSFQRKVARLLSKGVLMDIQKLQSMIRANVGDITFKEAYDRTKRILNITVSPTHDFGIPTLLNYLTAPNVLIWSAASASCALSFLYEPVELLAKDEFGNIAPYHPSVLKWSDGSVENDLPMTRLSELFNVNHFIVSQVNPHVIPFLGTSDSFENETLFSRLRYCVFSEFQHRINQLGNLGLIPRRLSTLPIVLSQKYRGDITIVPDFDLRDYAQILKNPTPAWIKDASLRSERKAWRKLSIIQHHLAIEIALDEGMQKLRKIINKVPEHALTIYKNKIK